MIFFKQGKKKNNNKINQQKWFLGENEHHKKKNIDNIIIQKEKRKRKASSVEIIPRPKLTVPFSDDSIDRHIFAFFPVTSNFYGFTKVQHIATCMFNS